MGGEPSPRSLRRGTAANMSSSWLNKLDTENGDENESATQHARLYDEAQQVFDALDVDNAKKISVSFFNGFLMRQGLFLAKDLRLASCKQKMEEKFGVKFLGNKVTQDAALDSNQFAAVIGDCAVLIQKAVRRQLAIPNWEEFTKIFDEVYGVAKGDESGENASYIPSLDEEHVMWDQFGMSITTVDGQHHSIGNTLNEFGIQSCSKPISFLLALRQFGTDYVLNSVGVEASGRAFNEIVLKPVADKNLGTHHERQIPHNAMINAGAMMAISMVFPDQNNRLNKVKEVWQQLSRGFAHNVSGPDERKALLADLGVEGGQEAASKTLKKGQKMDKPSEPMLTAEEMRLNWTMYRSESATANTNWALAHLMAGKGAFPPCFHELGERKINKIATEQAKLDTLKENAKQAGVPRRGSALVCKPGADGIMKYTTMKADEDNANEGSGTDMESGEENAVYENNAVALALQETLETYFQVCSIMSNNEMMSVMASTLATGGRNPYTGEQIFSTKEVNTALPIMITAGMYDYSGQWSFDVGVPAKSGVGGCIYMVIPGVCGITCFSPRLDRNGNSARGVKASRELSKRVHLNPLTMPGNDTFHLGNKSNNMEAEVNDILNAASLGDTRKLFALHSADIDLSQGDYDRRTALMVACSLGHVKVVEFLLDVLSPGEMAKTDRWGRNAADDAASCDTVSDVPQPVKDHVVKLLSDKGLKPTNLNATVEDAPASPVEATGTEHIEKLESMQLIMEMLWAAADSSVTGRDRLIAGFATFGGQGQVLTAADYDKRTPLHVAVSNGCVDNVKYLLRQAEKYGLSKYAVATRDVFGNKPLHDCEREIKNASNKEHAANMEAIKALLQAVV